MSSRSGRESLNAMSVNGYGLHIQQHGVISRWNNEWKTLRTFRKQTWLYLWRFVSIDGDEGLLVIRWFSIARLTRYQY